MAVPTPLGKCLFFDVGQGSANLILIRKASETLAFIIDAGPTQDNPLLKYLEKRNNSIDRIERVVLSHNDADHIRGWEELACRFGKKIKGVYLLQDRVIGKNDAVDVTMRLAETGVIPKPIRAEVRDLKEPMAIWEDKSLGAKLDLLYPDFLGNVRSQQSHALNRTCAIVRLTWQDKPILYSGDVKIDAWQRLKESGILPIHVEIFTVPHHGGLIMNENHASYHNELKWLFEEAVKSRFAIVSAGSSNPHKHPRPEVIDALVNANTHVICTQITSKCHNDFHNFVPSIAPLHEDRLFSRCQTDTTGKSVGCMGTIIAHLCENNITIEYLDEHRACVNRLSTPMCRRSQVLQVFASAQLKPN